MRYSADHREQTRQRILDAAAVVFRRQGFQAASVDTIMAQAGLTAGGFYAHFKSKDDLFAAAFRHALAQASLLQSVTRLAEEQAPESADQTSAPDAAPANEQLRTLAARYLSLAHRRMIDRGCPLPPLLADLPRQHADTRRIFQQVLEATAVGLQSQLPEPDRAPDRSLALVALLVGGLTLSRAVEDSGMAERILAACRELIDTTLRPSPAIADHTQNRQKRTPQNTKSPKPRQKGNLKS